MVIAAGDAVAHISVRPYTVLSLIDAQLASGKAWVSVYRVCKWVTIHGVTPRDWSLLGTKRD